MDGYHSLIHWVRLSSRNLCKQEWSLCERQLDWLLGSERPVWGPGGQEVPVRGRHDYWWDNKQQWGAHRGRESRIPDPHICNVGGYLAPLWHVGESGAGPNPMWLLFYNNRFAGVMHNALCHENVFFPWISCITVEMSWMFCFYSNPIKRLLFRILCEWSWTTHSLNHPKDKATLIAVFFHINKSSCHIGKPARLTIRVPWF